jgi:hypothetical protein
MARIIITCFAVLFALIAALPAQAQVSIEKRRIQDAYKEVLASFNSTNPAINPAYEKPEFFLHRQVLDSAKRVIGDSRDLIVGTRGQTQQVEVNVDRLQGLGRSGETLYFDYSMVTRQNISHAFELSVQSDEITAHMPEYLNATATAAGGGGTFALSRVRDAELRYGNGAPLGKVRGALLDDTGSQIEGLLLDNIRGAGASRKIALPYDPDKIKVGSSGPRLIFYLQAPYDEAFVRYAHDAR